MITILVIFWILGHDWHFVKAFTDTEIHLLPLYQQGNAKSKTSSAISFNLNCPIGNSAYLHSAIILLSRYLPALFI